MNGPSKKLVNVLLAKSLAETVLVGAIATIFFAKAFPPYFHGWGEVTGNSIVGWVVNNAAPWDRVEVQLFIDEKFAATGVANGARPDVLAAGWSKDEWHGYWFALPALSSGVHEGRVYATHESGGGVRRSLQLIGDPIHFRVEQNGVVKELNDSAAAP